MIFLSAGKRNAPPVELICIVASIARFMIPAHTMTAANLKPKECWAKAAPIFVIFSTLNKQQKLPSQLIQTLKTIWKRYFKKAHNRSLINYLYGTLNYGRGEISFVDKILDSIF